MHTLIKIFSIGDRANLIHNGFALAYLGTSSYALVSGLSSYMEFLENDYVPWRAFTWHITKIASVLEHRPSFEELRVCLFSFFISYLNFNRLFWV